MIKYVGCRQRGGHVLLTILCSFFGVGWIDFEELNIQARLGTNVGSITLDSQLHTRDRLYYLSGLVGTSLDLSDAWEFMIDYEYKQYQQVEQMHAMLYGIRYRLDIVKYVPWVEFGQIHTFFSRTAEQKYKKLKEKEDEVPLDRMRDLEANSIHSLFTQSLIFGLGMDRLINPRQRIGIHMRWRGVPFSGSQELTTGIIWAYRWSPFSPF